MSTTQTTTAQVLHASGGRAQVKGHSRQKPYHVVNKDFVKDVKPKSYQNQTNVIKAKNHSSGKHEAFSRPSPDDVNEPPAKRIKDLSVEEFKEFKSDSPIKRAGEFFLGPKHGSSPVRCIEQYLARKDGTDDFYVIKILTRKNPGEKETMDDIQGKTLLHTEHSLLSLVQNELGVIHEHGLFKETIKEQSYNSKGEVTTKEVRRLCLVLDCFMTHDFSPKYSNITNMQFHVIKEKKLPETDAIRIFFKVVQIVDRLHKLNIVHRDLKLGNIIFNKETKDVTLANFCLGKHLSSDSEMLKDQRGSPAYISPDVISGKPYLGKPSDMWALGVVLYTMLYGQFPFYDQNPTELFRKIKLGDFQIPADINVSSKTVELIRSLLHLDPKQRLTAKDTLEKVRRIIAEEQAFLSDSDLQVVPDCHPGADRPQKRSHSGRPSGLTDNPLVQAISDIVALLVGSDSESLTPEDDDYEPKCKKSNSNVPINGIGNITREDLERLQTMCRARKERKSLAFDDVPTLCSSNGNRFPKCATNNDSACVPDSDFNNANVMNPTSGGRRNRELESKIALLLDPDNVKMAHRQKSSNFNFYQAQA